MATKNLYEKLQTGLKADWVIEIQENETAQEVKSKTSIIAIELVVMDIFDCYIQSCREESINHLLTK